MNYKPANCYGLIQLLSQYKRLGCLILLSWAIIIAIYAISRYWQIEFNVTTSLPQKLWLTHVGNKNITRNDYAVFKFHDPRMQHPSDYEFVVKQVGGIAGDKIIVKNNNNAIFTVQYILNNEIYIVYAKLGQHKFSALTITDLIIPQNHYFMHGQVQPTFDSRYKEFGLISESQIYGKSYPIF